MSHTAIVPDHATLRNFLMQHRLPLYFSKPVIQHVTTYMAAAQQKGSEAKLSILLNIVIATGQVLGIF